MNRNLTGLAAAAALLALPATAGAGWHGTNPDVLTERGIGCVPAPSCTIAQERLSNTTFTDLPLGGAARGVIVRWRVNGEDGTARLRRVGANPGATDPLTMTDRRIYEGTANLPVQQGDVIGLDLTGTGAVAFVPDEFGMGADVLRRWAPALGDGAAPPAGETVGGYALYDFYVEADKDGDGLGDESQDPDRGTPVVIDPIDRTPVDPGPRTPVDPIDGTPEEAVPASGPTVEFGASSATRKGTVSIALVNPYAVATRGRVTLKLGKRSAGTARVSLAADGARTVKLKLSKAAAKQLARKRKLKLTVSVTLSAAGGKARTTSKAITFKLAATPRRAPTGPGARGYDGKYRASDGHTMIVRGGIVEHFQGDLTLFCTKAKVQRRTFFAMLGDDPKPRVAPNGSFSWEATRGYGFEKLRFSGRIKGDTATGRLMVEDRSPLLGTGRIEFDYCFAGKEFKLTR